MPANALNARAMNVRGRVSPHKLKVCKSVLHDFFWGDGGEQPKMRPGRYRRGGFNSHSTWFTRSYFQIKSKTKTDNSNFYDNVDMSFRMVRRREWPRVNIIFVFCALIGK